LLGNLVGLLYDLLFLFGEDPVFALLLELLRLALEILEQFVLSKDLLLLPLTLQPRLDAVLDLFSFVANDRVDLLVCDSPATDSDVPVALLLSLQQLRLLFRLGNQWVGSGLAFPELLPELLCRFVDEFLVRLFRVLWGFVQWPSLHSLPSQLLLLIGIVIAQLRLIFLERLLDIQLVF